MTAPFDPSCCARLVVKIGSSLLVDPAGAIRREWLDGIAADIAERCAAGQQVAVVSSGAIALGARLLGLPKGGRANLEDAQAAAATGQIALSGTWAELLARHGLRAAQMLLTLGDLEDRRRYLNAAATLARLLALGVVPVINENDSVATAEIRFGDNDRLAARVAQAASADGVLLLSDVAGLFTADPARVPDAELIAQVDDIDAVAPLAGDGSGSGMGSGGMRAKLEAARIAVRAGVPLAIASGRDPHPLRRFGETGRGTLFAAGAPGTARKAWLSGRLTAAGSIRIDDGAVRALLEGGSLLAPGAVAIEGRFGRSDVVDIIAHADGRPIARGLSEYDAADAARIAGRPRADQAALLGCTPRAALVHRDHLVLL